MRNIRFLSRWGLRITTSTCRIQSKSMYVVVENVIIRRCDDTYGKDKEDDTVPCAWSSRARPAKSHIMRSLAKFRVKDCPNIYFRHWVHARQCNTLHRNEIGVATSITLYIIVWQELLVNTYFTLAKGRIDCSLTTMQVHCAYDYSRL